MIAEKEKSKHKLAYSWTMYYKPPQDMSQHTEKDWRNAYHSICKCSTLEDFFELVHFPFIKFFN